MGKSELKVKDQPTTLGEFIQEYVHRERISNRALAEKLETSHSVVNRLSWHGLREEYGGQPIGDPSLELLIRMAKAMYTDICVLAALVAPQAVRNNSPEAIILADRILRLNPHDKELAVGFIRGALLKGSD